MSFGPVEITKGFLQINPCERHLSEFVLRTPWIQQMYYEPLLQKRIPSMLPEQHSENIYHGSKTMQLGQLPRPPLLFMGNQNRLLFGQPIKMFIVKAMTKSLSRPELCTNGPAPSPTRQRQVMRGNQPQSPRNICLSPSQNDRDSRDLRRIPPGTHPRQEKSKPLKAEAVLSQTGEGSQAQAPRTQGPHAPTGFLLEASTPQPAPPQQQVPNNRHRQDGQLVPLASPRTTMNPPACVPFLRRPSGDSNSSASHGIPGPMSSTMPAVVGFRPMIRPQPLRDITPFSMQRERSAMIGRQSPFARQQLHPGAAMRPIDYATPLPLKSPGR